MPDSQPLADSPGQPHDLAHIPHLSSQTVVRPVRVSIGPVRQMHRLFRPERSIERFRDKRHEGREEARGGVERQLKYLVARRLRGAVSTTPCLRTGQPQVPSAQRLNESLDGIVARAEVGTRPSRTRWTGEAALSRAAGSGPGEMESRLVQTARMRQGQRRS